MLESLRLDGAVLMQSVLEQLVFLDSLWLKVAGFFPLVSVVSFGGLLLTDSEELG